LRLILARFFNSLVKGSNDYETAKKDLQDAIAEYDEAVFDLIVSVVAGCCISATWLTARFEGTKGHDKVQERE